MLNEASFVKRLQAKEESAFQELIIEFGPRLLRTAKLLTGNESSAEELVCDTFANAFLGINKFRQESNLFTWLYRILLNEFYYQLRRHRKEIVLDAFIQQQILKMLGMTNSDPTALAFSRQYLSDLLSKVSAEHREVLLLKYIEGLSIKEIVQYLKIPENTVKTRLHRAINNLRKLLEQGNFLPE